VRWVGGWVVAHLDRADLARGDLAEADLAHVERVVIAAHAHLRALGVRFHNVVHGTDGY
jgi:hypothetical protein